MSSDTLGTNTALLENNPLNRIVEIVRGEDDLDSYKKVVFLSVLIFLKRHYDSDGFMGYGNQWLDLEALLSGEHKLSKVNETLKWSVEFVLLLMNDDPEDCDPDFPFSKKEVAEFINDIPVSTYIAIQVLHYLQSIDISKEKYNEIEFSRMYVDFITKIFSTKKSGFFSLSSTVRSLIVGIAITSGFSEVYDPFCGTGTFLADIGNEVVSRYKDRRVSLFAQDIVPELYFINFFLSSFSTISIKISIDNSIINPVADRKFDLVVSEIPFGSRLSTEEMDFIDSDKRLSLYRSSKDFLCVNAILAATSEKGRAIAVVPSGMLSQSGKTIKIREKMIADDVIETVIQLPANLYNPYSNIKTAIIVFNKNKGADAKGKVQFIDASRIIDSSGKDNIQQIVDIFKTKEVVEMVSSVVSRDKIIENKCDLSPSIYTGIFNMLENQFKNKEKLYSLEDVATIATGRSAKDENIDSYKIKLLKIADLKEDILDVYVDNKYIGKYSSIRKDRVRIIDKECLLIAKIGTSLKPTIFKPDANNSQDEIAQDVNVLGIVPKENLLLEYLYYLFYDPVVTVQVDTFKTSSSFLPTIRPENLRKLKIPVPSLTDQKRYIEREKFRLIEIEKKAAEARINKISADKMVFEAESGIISTLAHNTLPDVTTMEGDIKTLQKFLDKKQLLESSLYENDELDDFSCVEDLDVALSSSEVYNEAVSDLINRVLKNLKRFEYIISKTKEIVQVKIERKDFVEVSLKDLLLSVKDDFKQCENLDVRIKGKDARIFLHLETFEAMLKNIIRNALSHGFSNFSEKKKINFNIEVNMVDGLVDIIYENNGHKFQISKEEFIATGRKGRLSEGSGLGGYYINKVIKAHGGDFYIDMDHPGMKMIITIPIMENTNG